MPINDGKMATKKDIEKAIRIMNPFRLVPGIEYEIVVPEPHPDPKKYKDRKNRAYIKEKGKKNYLLSCPSAYQMVVEIYNGWIYNPEDLYKEGLREHEEDSE